MDCSNVEIKNQIKANILVKIRARLFKLVKRFVQFCYLQESSDCFAHIEVAMKSCKTATSRKRAREPSTIDVDLNIPDLGYCMFNKKK